MAESNQYVSIRRHRLVRRANDLRPWSDWLDQVDKLEERFMRVKYSGVALGPGWHAMARAHDMQYHASSATHRDVHSAAI